MVSYERLKKVLSKAFPSLNMSLNLVSALFNRFKKTGEDIIDHKADLVAVGIFLVLITRVSYEKQVYLLLRLFDDNNNGFVTVTNIRLMIFKVKQLEEQERAKTVSFPVFVDFAAQQKATPKANFVVGLLKTKLQEKTQEEKLELPEIKMINLQ